MISVIVLTCDSQIGKSFCLQHCLLSILIQDYSDYEIIVVDNGSVLTNHTEALIVQLSSEFPDVVLKRLDLGGTKPRGMARNAGADAASAEFLLFLDEDVILVERDTLKLLAQGVAENKWGCGASRLWTTGNWFDLNVSQLLSDIGKGDFSALLKNSGDPEPFIRGSNETAIEARSMIGHFGCCHKLAFEEVGGFEDVGEANSFDDDILNIKLFQSFGYPWLFPELKIVHVNHPIFGSRTFDFTFYFKYLVSHAIFDFDSEKLIWGGPENEILTPLGSVHYHSKILEAFAIYEADAPLNHPEMDAKQFSFWQENVRLQLDDYCRTLAAILRAEKMEDYIKENYSDYDNLAPIVKSMIKSGLIRTVGEQIIDPLFSFTHLRGLDLNVKKTNSFEPNASYNQFPCNPLSVIKRVELLRNRYPYCEFLRLGIIGDDDFLAEALRHDIWVQPIVVEKDPVILSYYARDGHIKTVELDLLDVVSDHFIDEVATVGKVHTFILDPPYTLHGALSFIFAGLSIMEFDGREKEFYMVINPSIIGKPLIQLFQWLAQAGIVVKEIFQAFNSYPFPANYAEKTRAAAFNNQNNIGSLFLSSTSNLYILSTVNPDLDALGKLIDANRFYDHYQLTD